MSSLVPDLPTLADDEIHVWQIPWTAGAGEQLFVSLLANYAGPDVPPVARGEHGKPYFPAPFGGLGFNWSHSGDRALFAIGRGDEGFELGVDVERVRPRPRALELARRFFAADEAAMLASLPGDAQLNAFLRLWTAKEAVLKANGGGLSYGLHRVAFEIDDKAVKAVAFDGEIAPSSAWRIEPLDLGLDCVAAVAWRGRARTIRVFTYAL
ncbi:MAG TPA: 4'-phosphopantetheinyl transferase superfamily protein [Luteibacter sp.]|uniref:4'-phosphopantetheinyl transferase family protein n=1 Tax=Luteibacter sp. TaxID=1886636 RepID=UPI002C534859|nr:4'-phosphopantetheinyl transferase superfamily protein [Luteibacter sp.]HVI53649.1 4'-phosphopantetheinyl transferase superfamily protein [Luteibacter sp.]